MHQPTVEDNLLLIKKIFVPSIFLFNEVGNYGILRMRIQNECRSLNSLLNWLEMFFKTDFQS